MINELIIHLGDTKTGSTSIQKALVRNIGKAPGVTITYPTSFNHNGLATTLYKKRRLGERAARFDRIYAALEKSDANYGVISAEHFQMVDPQHLHQAIATHWPGLINRLRLVAYVRPHAGKFLSAYAEKVKLGAMKLSLEDSFEASFGTGWLDYTSRFEKWRATFGDHFELRPFVRGQLYQGDVVSDFYRFVLGSENFELTGTVSANTSSTLGQLSLLREVHKQLENRLGSRKGPRLKDAQSALGRIVSEYMQSNGLGQDGDKPQMPASIVDRFKERYAPDARAMDAAFFDGSPMSDALDKSHLKATDAVQSLDAGDHFSAEVISTVHVFANVLADFLAEKPDHLKQAIANSRAKTEIDA